MKQMMTPSGRKLDIVEQNCNYERNKNLDKMEQNFRDQGTTIGGTRF